MTTNDTNQFMQYVSKVTSLEGIFVCPEGAATAAVLPKFLHGGEIEPEEKVLLMNTGSGLKNLELF